MAKKKISKNEQTIQDHPPVNIIDRTIIQYFINPVYKDKTTSINVVAEYNVESKIYNLFLYIIKYKNNSVQEIKVYEENWGENDPGEIDHDFIRSRIVEIHSAERQDLFEKDYELVGNDFIFPKELVMISGKETKFSSYEEVMIGGKYMKDKALSILELVKNI